MPEVGCCQSKKIQFRVVLLIDNVPSHPPTTLIDFDLREKVVCTSKHDLLAYVDWPKHLGLFH